MLYRKYQPIQDFLHQHGEVEETLNITSSRSETPKPKKNALAKLSSRIRTKMIELSGRKKKLEVSLNLHVFWTNYWRFSKLLKWFCHFGGRTIPFLKKPSQWFGKYFAKKMIPKHQNCAKVYRSLELQATSFLWLFQLEDSKSLHKKWIKMVVSPNKKWLFRVPRHWIICPNEQSIKTTEVLVGSASLILTYIITRWWLNQPSWKNMFFKLDHFPR